VEDNVEMRAFICMILRDDYLILEAENGEEGLKMALKKLPDLIISDYMMPVMDGIEMVKTLRSNIQTSHIPVIILSARTDEESKIRGFDTGADSYIDKPFSADILRSRINNLIERRRNLQRIYQQKYIEKKDGVLSTGNEADKLFMDKLTGILEKNIGNDEINVDNVADLMGMSRSVYFKKLKSLTGLGPNDFLKRLRMQRAATLIDKGLYNNFDIAAMVGIGDAHYFSKCFKLYFGMTPTEWKKRKRDN
jgi:DNA-binding response OmpR family regulator